MSAGQRRRSIPDLRHLEYFVSVVDEGSFTKAAMKAYVAQSGVSAQIRRLERELGGGDLLDRTGTTVRPTAVGEAVLPYARAALAAVREAQLVIDEMVGLVRGRLVIGSIGSRRVNIAELLAGFHRTYPAVDITLTEADSLSLEERLLTGSMDAAIVSRGRDRPSGLAYQDLVDDEIAGAVCADDSLVGLANIDIDALRDRDIVTLQPGAGTRSRFEAACKKAGFTPRIRFEVSDPAVVAELAAHGLGLAILPASFATSVDALHCFTIGEPPLRAQVALAWRDAPGSPASRALLAYARSVYDQTLIFSLQP
ncbi:LysR substrate binding domain protein [Mycobacterium parascrofulaceum ATCC BAA-614]|uniref:Probable hydrogen peroxide-inducible genes activator n=1 Tax=Mycobacterium parascrofulaceum ATCC BAA-614 TaxID=525368 RepID=D5P2E1_9MYCO|nr:LysR family transcriptional regulator [Mycobacterium parascrofulaceum]EFG79753.1 LysR substrate binding domain protein [Mycobacterium parascrofulaceum ATCC BAA-614]